MAKREPHWVKLFLRELERTGNVRLAAERAGVDFSTAYQRRKRHGEFAERWEGTLAAHKVGVQDDSPLTPLRSAESPSPPEGGEGLVARPDGKAIKGSEARWGKRAEERFLTELTVSANVRLAAKSAGFSTTAVYQRRLKNRHFAAAWDAAVEVGRARVHSYLVEAATRTFDPDELPVGDEREIPKVSIGEAINIAKLAPRDAGGPGSSTRGGKGFEGRTYDDGGFDTTPISRDEWEEARNNIFHRLQRLREQTQEQEQETGRCHSCGQPLSNPCQPA